MKNAQLTSWVKEYTRDMLSWARHKVTDPATAEDLVQDTFLAAAEQIDTFRNDSSPRTWLFSILNNKIAGYYRSSLKFTNISIGAETSTDDFFDEAGHWKRHIIPTDWENSDIHLLDDPIFIETFQGCLDRLPAVWYSCVRLKYLEQKEAEIICQETGLSPTNYWQIVHRAKLQLRRCLEQHWFKKNRE